MIFAVAYNFDLVVLAFALVGVCLVAGYVVLPIYDALRR